MSGVLVLALLIADVPLKARWALSRSEFEDLLNEVMTDDSFRLTQDRRVGSYNVIVIDRRDGAVIFYDDVGTSIANDAGFAYLPNGPSPDLANSGFENPRFRHLGGHWYAFTASW